MNYEDQDPWLTIASMSGLPSTVAPIGHSTYGLPIGVQIIGPHMGDRTTIAFAGLIERELGGFSPPGCQPHHRSSPTTAASRIDTCAYRKSNPDIFVMQSAKDRAAKNTPCPLYGAR
jgi:hypothetical protein